MTARLEPRPSPGPRCGWPFRLVNTSTVVNCNLPFGHDGPLCELRDENGETKAAVPRFGNEGCRR